MPSKAQGLSLNTIVIAAIVLIVLLLLVGLLTGYFGKVWKPTFGRLTETSCVGQGGQEKNECNANSEKEVFAAETTQGKKCCATKSCEERGGSCCTGGAILINNDPGCRAKNQNAPNCCS